MDHHPVRTPAGRAAESPTLVEFEIDTGDPAKQAEEIQRRKRQIARKLQQY